MMAVGKQIRLCQVDSSTVVPAAPASLPYVFSSDVVVEGVGLPPAPRITGPIFNIEPGHNGGVLGFDPDESSWGYGAPDFDDWQVATRGELDALFGEGTYTFEVGPESVSVELSGDRYPVIPPQAELIGGTWRNGEYHISFGETLSAQTSGFDGWCADGVDAAVLSVFGPGYMEFTELICDPANPGSSVIQMTIPGGALAAGETYQVDVEFIRTASFVAPIPWQPACDGCFAAAFFAFDTELTVRVGPGCVGDFDGNGLFDLADITGFIGAFIEMDDMADVHIDGLWDLADLVRFVTDFSSACEG